MKNIKKRIDKTEEKIKPLDDKYRDNEVVVVVVHEDGREEKAMRIPWPYPINKGNIRKRPQG